MFTAEFLSRVQFALTIGFHILFPAFSIGLATFLAVMEGIWLKTKNPLYLNICKFWMKIFALTFGMGVVSGIVMEFQLGTNWSGFTNSVGGVLGSLFTYEVLTAFFIEAGFLGVMLFGWNKVGPKLHYCATLLVFLGVTISAFWILSANSWMQTPAGATIQNGHFIVQSWHDVIFNPSVVPRYIHMMLAAYLTTLLVVAGVAAYYLLKQQHTVFAKKCFSIATLAILPLILLQMFMGDAVGLVIEQHQPIKTAAIEANWVTQQGAPLILFAWPNDAKETNQFTISIPHLASVLNTHQWNGVLQGLTSVPAEDRPYVPIVFFSFRIMVGLGLLMLLIGLLACYLRLRARLHDTAWFHKLCLFLSPIGFAALITGWFTAETGRQPWIVYNMIKTSEAASNVSMHNVSISLVLILLVYGIIFGFFYFLYFGKIVGKGPESAPEIEMPFSYLHPEEEEK